MKTLNCPILILLCTAAVSLIMGIIPDCVGTTPDEEEEETWISPWSYGPRGGFYFSWEPWEELRDLQERINRIVDDAYWRFGQRGVRRVPYTGLGFYPDVDVAETEKEIVVKCDLPGLEKEKIDVTFRGGHLIISGTREVVKEERKGAGWSMRERSYGSFERVIPIQTQVKEDEITAEYKDGVLNVTLPKLKPEIEKGKKIHII